MENTCATEQIVTPPTQSESPLTGDKHRRLEEKFMKMIQERGRYTRNYIRKCLKQEDISSTEKEDLIEELLAETWLRAWNNLSNRDTSSVNYKLLPYLHAMNAVNRYFRIKNKQQKYKQQSSGEPEIFRKACERQALRDYSTKRCATENQELRSRRMKFLLTVKRYVNEHFSPKQRELFKCIIDAMVENDCSKRKVSYLSILKKMNDRGFRFGKGKSDEEQKHCLQVTLGNILYKVRKHFAGYLKSNATDLDLPRLKH